MIGIPEKALLSIEEVAEILGISPVSIRHYTGKNSPKPFFLPVFRVGRLVKFKRTDLVRFLEGDGADHGEQRDS